MVIWERWSRLHRAVEEGLFLVTREEQRRVLSLRQGEGFSTAVPRLRGVQGGCGGRGSRGLPDANMTQSYQFDGDCEVIPKALKLRDFQIHAVRVPGADRLSVIEPHTVWQRIRHAIATHHFRPWLIAHAETGRLATTRFNIAR